VLRVVDFAAKIPQRCADYAREVCVVVWRRDTITVFERSVWRSDVKERHMGRRSSVPVAFTAGLFLAFFVLTATAGVAQAQRFTDIGGDEWFAEAVLRLAEDGIVYGRDDGSFSPYDPVTRGELSVYLDRILHLRGSLDLPFADVTAFDWYSGAVAGMYEAGLISGTSATTFSPNAPVSRQQAAALLIRSLAYRLEQDTQDPLSASSSTSPVDLSEVDGQTAVWLAGFQDRALVAVQHAGHVANAYRLGLMEGTSDGWFYPALSLSRAQMVAMLYRAFYQPLEVRTDYPVEVPAVSAYPTQSKGSQGALVLFLESRLSELCYPCGDVDGVYDERTRDAVMAFEKVEKLPRDGVAGEEVWQRIFSAQTPAPHLAAPGTRVEVDLTRQVLFVITDNAVKEIVHVSTGKIGTPTGHGNIWLRQQGWQECSVGWMYYPCYFWPRIAIHGSSSVPPYPASHGCVRTPTWISAHMYDQLLMGMSVDVYY
jgi:N-acetylmuramoyl-L-alanine amidase